MAGEIDKKMKNERSESEDGTVYKNYEKVNRYIEKNENNFLNKIVCYTIFYKKNSTSTLSYIQINLCLKIVCIIKLQCI